MCGIFGIVGFNANGLFYNDAKIFMQGLVADSVRGMDGTGAFAVTEDGHPTWVKYGGTAMDLFRTKQMEEWLSDALRENSFCLVGHNRYATAGAHTTANAHPFQHKHITLVHNGNFINRGSVLGRFTDLHANDSESLCEALSMGPEKDILAKVEGALSIVFWNEKTKRLCFFRNDQRPMWLAEIKGKNKFIFGSEQGMINWICERNDLQVKSIVETSSRKLYQISMAGKIKTQNIPSPAVIVAATPSTVVGQEHFDWSDYDAGYFAAGENQKIQQLAPPPRKPKYSGMTTTVSYLPPASPPAPYVPPKQEDKENWKFPQEMLGYKVGEYLTFGVVDRVKTSGKQEQFKLIGQGMACPEFEVWAYVKGEEYSRKCVTALCMRGQIRGFRTMKAENPAEKVCIAIVSNVTIEGEPKT